MNHYTVSNFRQAKLSGEKITMLTAYDYPTARILDESGIDSILVGDSLGMVVLGYEDTIKVTMEDMIHHIKAVVRGTKHALVIGDLPFLSYHTGKYDSVRNAGRLLQEGGCQAVKMEGGIEILDDVKAIIAAGIPVMGHLGYTPQSVNLFGGHKAQGKTVETAVKIFRDAMELQKAGVFGITLECVPYKVASLISERLDIPTIGIGSGAGCDGQVIVTPDLIGLFREFTPKHVKKYLNLSKDYEGAVKQYMQEVREGIFPTEVNSFIADETVLEALRREME